MLVNIFAPLIASLTLFPLLSFVLIYIVVLFSFKSKDKALQWAINVTTFLILVSITMTIKQLWNVSLLWLFIVLILLIGAGLTYLQYSLHGQVLYPKLLKGIIRLTFLIFVPVHIFLYIWVVIRSVFVAIQ